MSAHKPTAEQDAITTAVTDGGSLVIEAGAGTGKTSTLRLVAEVLAPKRGLYLAYNKAIQLEASATFPSNVECRTAHSMAYREFGGRNKRRLSAKRLSAKQYAAILGIQQFSYKVGDEDFTLSPRQIAVIVRESISRFCNSADTEPSRYHLPYQQMDPIGGDSKANWERFTAHVLPYLRAAWQDITNPNGQLTFTHDCYLKMWSLSNPTLNYDFILFDEAQDANPAISVVVQNQVAQQIMVGDRAQAIYGWRGAVDAMQNFKADHHLYLTQSFRFGPTVAEQANRWLTHVGTPLRLTGFEKIQSTVGALDAPDAILCRTNAGCIESAMKYQEAGLNVAISGGTREIEAFVKAANDLMQGLGTDHADLGAFRDWSEVQQAVKNGEASDLGMMVRLVDNYGTHAILNVCRNTAYIAGDQAVTWASEPGNVMISTAHKAKGLEWNHVQIHNDFKPPKDGGAISVTEAMLIYVAVTRAKQTLDNGALAWLDQMEADIAEAMDAEAESAAA